MRAETVDVRTLITRLRDAAEVRFQAQISVGYPPAEERAAADRLRPQMADREHELEEVADGSDARIVGTVTIWESDWKQFEAALEATDLNSEKPE